MVTVIAQAEMTPEGVVFHWPESVNPESATPMRREALESWIEAIAKMNQRGSREIDLTIVNPLEFA